MNKLANGIMCAFVLLSVLPRYGYAQDVDRTKRPPAKPAPVVTLPTIQKATLGNGLRVWLVEHHELPIAAFNCVIQAGSDHDPLDQPGLAAMTADLLDEGTEKRDALQISEELESVGASMGVSASFDGSFATLTCLTKHLDRALDVYLDVLIHPTFPEKGFARLKNQRLTVLIQQRDQPPTIANNAFSYVIYGPNHPYGNNPTGTEASLGVMTRDNLVRFYETYYRPGNATMIVVGDVKLDEVVARLEKASADWKMGAVPAFDLPAPTLSEGRQVFLIDKPGAPQSEIRIGYPALSRDTPDFFPVMVMNRILGGQFSSRINLNLRERHGYTYGANSSFAFRKGVGPFIAQSAVISAKTDSALREFLYEIDLMHDKGMSPEELEFAEKGLIGGYALVFETPAQIAGRLQDLVLYNLPDDFYQTYLINIGAVTLEDVGGVARKYLDSSRMGVVVVGDVAAIRPAIEAAGIGKIVLCDLDGKKLEPGVPGR